jgi:hypothetical protein
VGGRQYQRPRPRRSHGTVPRPAQTTGAGYVRQYSPLRLVAAAPPCSEEITAPAAHQPQIEQHFAIQYGDTGYTYDTIFESYLAGAKAVTIEDP